MQNSVRPPPVLGDGRMNQRELLLQELHRRRPGDLFVRRPRRVLELGDGRATIHARHRHIDSPAVPQEPGDLAISGACIVPCAVGEHQQIFDSLNLHNLSSLSSPHECAVFDRMYNVFNFFLYICQPSSYCTWRQFVVILDI